MKKTALVLAAVLALTSPVWAQWKIGAGGSFGAASPMCDVFAEVTLNEALGNLTEEFQGFNVAIRCNLGTMVSDEGVSAFTFDATALVPLSLEMIQAYFGAGAGAGGGKSGGVDKGDLGGDRKAREAAIAARLNIE